VNRALPSSLLIHITALLLIFLFGTWVDRPMLKPMRTLNVQMVSMPKIVNEIPEPTREEPPPEVIDQTVEPEIQPAPEPEPEPLVIEPQPVPIPQPVEQVPVPIEPANPPAEQPRPLPEVATEVPRETAITGTDQEVPAQFQYYITLLQGRVARNWNPKRLGFREGSQRHCVVYFSIERDGRLTRENIERSSGVSLFDQEALGAVRRVGRMPPLPSGIRGASLGVHFTFTLETGS